MKQQDNSFSCVIRLSSLTLPPEVIDHTKTGGGKGGWGIIVRRGEARRGANNHDRDKLLCFRKKEDSDTLKEEIQICRAIKQFDNY